MKFDVIVIGGGLAGMTAATELQTKGLHCAVINFGVNLSRTDSSEFIAAGGEFFKGDKVVSGKFEEGRLKSISTLNLGQDALEAEYFIIATGKYFTRGLESAPDRIYEPVFGLDVNYENDHSKWFNEDFDAPQPFLSFGINTLASKAYLDGAIVGNLYAAGEILCGIDPTTKDSENRIKASAVKAASQILKDAGIQQ